MVTAQNLSWSSALCGKDAGIGLKYAIFGLVHAK